MFLLNNIYQQPLAMVGGLLLIAAWTTLWKGLGLWYSGKHEQKGWFVAILLLNTLGLLPIIYLIWFRRKPGIRITKRDAPIARSTEQPVHITMDDLEDDQSSEKVVKKSPVKKKKKS